jgi:hypothetical protein
MYGQLTEIRGFSFFRLNIHFTVRCDLTVKMEVIRRLFRTCVNSGDTKVVSQYH